MHGVNLTNIPACGSYATAKRIWDNAEDHSGKPVWGSCARPLDSVRMRHKAITKHDDGSFSFDLYMTEMVRYYPDGTVGGTVDERVASIAFFRKVGPLNTALLRAHDHTFLVFAGKAGKENYVNPVHGKFKLKSISPAWWQLLTPAVQRTRMVPDRKKLNAIGKAFKPFYEWVAAAEKVTGHCVVGADRRRPVFDGITMPPTLDQYPQLLTCGKSLDDLKLRLNEHFGAYSRVGIPNTERPRRSKLGHWQDT